MTETRKAALVFGAASSLGAAVSCAVTPKDYDYLLLAAPGSERPAVSALISGMKMPRESIRIEETDISAPSTGLSQTAFNIMDKCETDIFHIASRLDRTLSASAIYEHNALALLKILEIGRTIKQVGCITVITDVGLSGDYPGKFSESWTDVGQTPFDDVDKSSLQIEKLCLEQEDLPIIRARTGLLLSNPEQLKKTKGRQSLSETLLGSVKWLSKLPRFITLPSAVAQGCLAPITPTDWAAKVLIHMASQKKGIGAAHHLVIDPKPPMENLLRMAANQLGGAQIKGGLPVNLVTKLGLIPGLKETARRNADHLASWWTPHRYCLSQNDLDTTRTKALLSPELQIPQWNDVKDLVR